MHWNVREFRGLAQAMNKVEADSECGVTERNVLSHSFEALFMCEAFH